MCLRVLRYGIDPSTLGRIVFNHWEPRDPTIHVSVGWLAGRGGVPVLWAHPEPACQAYWPIAAVRSACFRLLHPARLRKSAQMGFTKIGSAAGTDLLGGRNRLDLAACTFPTQYHLTSTYLPPYRPPTYLVPMEDGT